MSKIEGKSKCCSQLFYFLGITLWKLKKNMSLRNKIVWCTIPSSLNRIWYIEEISLLIKILCKNKTLGQFKTWWYGTLYWKDSEEIGVSIQFNISKTLYSKWINIVIEDIFQFWQLDWIIEELKAWREVMIFNLKIMTSTHSFSCILDYMWNNLCVINTT